MDRNTRIGFALIFLLLVLWSLWMSRFSKKAPEQTLAMDSLATTESVTPPPASTDEPATPPVETGAAPSVESAPRQQVVVETEHARYLLDSRGAVLRRIELLDYAGVASDYVELIGDVAEGDTVSVLGVDLDLPGGPFRTAGAGFALLDPPSGGKLTLKGEEEASLRFRLSDAEGGELIKRYGFKGNSYDVSLGIDATLRGALAGADGVTLDWSPGIEVTEKNRKDDLRSFQSVFRVGEQQEKKGLRNFKHGEGERAPAQRSEEGTVQWVATKNKYFLAALVPVQLETGQAILVGDESRDALGWRAHYPLNGQPGRYAAQFKVYAGPLLFDTLKAHGRGLEHLVDLGKLIRPISLAIKWLMDFLSRFIPNYGVIIILLSLFTKVLFYRLSHKSLKSMKEMQAIQPQLKALQEKYKGDRERLNKETLELYKQAGVNPLGGCLPMLLQMPVFFALYRVLRGAVELRGAGFMLWIDDLSNMDVVYHLPFNLPLLGGFIDNSISVLPILMGLSMWVQQKLGGSGMGMGAESPQAGQMAAMNKIMPIFMTFIFYRMPSGLVLYWLVNNILQAVQQYYIHKGLDKPRVISAGA
ncbi:membrane protein insertase YidC [bacterium]|nr:membrane protein insertase YidC [bacterium]